MKNTVKRHLSLTKGASIIMAFSFSFAYGDVNAKDRDIRRSAYGADIPNLFSQTNAKSFSNRGLNYPITKQNVQIQDIVRGKVTNNQAKPLSVVGKE